MVNREAAKALIKTYFPGASEEQVEVILKELTQEIEVKGGIGLVPVML
jgi:hypothetical protein